MSLKFWGVLGHDALKVLSVVDKALDIVDPLLQSPAGLLIEATIPGAAQIASIEHLARIHADSAEVLFAGIEKSGALKRPWSIAQAQAMIDLVMNIESTVTGKPPTKLMLDVEKFGAMIDKYVNDKNWKATQTAPVVSIVPVAA